ncbi:MAG: hypothetical protein SPC96_08630, partial [Desulfovibrio sp.]|nr:hypothetical protein [Desulfovibrio sp.]
AHHENLFVSWDEITTPFKIKKHAGHPLNARFLKYRFNLQARSHLKRWIFRRICPAHARVVPCAWKHAGCAYGTTTWTAKGLFPHREGALFSSELL